MKNKKPHGIVLISIYCAFWGVSILPVGCMASMASGVAGVPGYAGPLGYIILLFGIASIAGAYGLWTVQPWGRDFNIWINLAGLPFSLMTLFGLSLGGKVTGGDRFMAVVGIVLTVVVYRYLTSDSIKQFFDPSDVSDWEPVEPKL